MSRRTGSSINSHYFTSDPVVVRETGSRYSGNYNAFNKSSFFTKGEETSPSRKLMSGNETLNSMLPSGEANSSQPSNNSGVDPQQSGSSKNPEGSSHLSFSSGSKFSVSSSQSTSSSNSVSAGSNSSSDDSSSNSESDVFTVQSADGPLQVDRGLLRETLIRLKGDAQTLVNQLSAEKTEDFKSVMEALRALYNSPSAHEVMLNDIRREFENISPIKPGTVAAFFVGCFTGDKFPGPIGCSPKCVASIFPTSGTPGYSQCDDLVLIYFDGVFSSLNEKRSAHAYIYVGESNFNGFSVENVKQLRDSGIENASIIFGNPDGTFREVTSVLALDQLPKQNGKGIRNAGQTGSNGTSSGSNTDGNSNGSMGGGVVLLIIIIVVIVILLYLIYRDNYR
jgi:hypothetical protein